MTDRRAPRGPGELVRLAHGSDEESRTARRAVVAASLALSAIVVLATGPRAVPPLQAEDTASIDLAVPPATTFEWRVRRWALAPLAAREELAAALASAEWTQRAAAQEALARAAAAGTLTPEGELLDLARGALVRGVDDEHPNVRAGATSLLAAALWLPLPDTEQLRALADDTLPAVRLDLARALGRRAAQLDAAQVERLSALARDGDGRVAEAARVGLFALADPAPAALLFGEVFATEDPDARVALAELLTHTRGLSPFADNEPGLTPELTPEARAAHWAIALRGALDTALAEQPETLRERRALLEAALFVAGGPGDARALAEGWESADAMSASVARGALLARGARRAGPELAGELMARLVQRRDGAEAGGRDADFELEQAWIDAAAASAGGGVLRDPSAVRLAPDLAVSLLEALLQRVGDVEPEDLAPWLDPARTAAERAAALRLGSHIVDAPGERGARAGAQLVLLLRDPEESLADDAWLALADAEDVRPWLEALHTAWLAHDPAEQPRDLARLSREFTPTPFRADLLAIGERGGAARAAVFDLLELFPLDAEIAAALLRWLDEDCAIVADEAALEQQRRLAELRAMGALRALANIGRPEDTSAVEGALVWSRGRSTQVGKVAAAALGRLPGGLARLPAHLDEDTDRRTRIEAAIVLARSPRGGGEREGDAVPVDAAPVDAAPIDSVPIDAALVDAAIGALRRDLPAAAWDLRRRMVGALEDSGRPDARAALEEALFDPRTDGDGRVGIVAALVDLGEVGRGPLAPVFARVADEPDHEALEPRRTALQALAHLGAVEELRRLESQYEKVSSVPGIAGETAQLLADEARVGRAVHGALDAEERRSLLDPPLAAAAHDLHERYAGETSLDTEFHWRSLLSVAHALAGRGQLGECLASRPWWRLDSELLRALAARAQRGEPATARRLVRGAHVALLGEPEPGGRSLVEVLVRARDLAVVCGAELDRERAEAALDWARREGRSVRAARR